MSALCECGCGGVVSIAKRTDQQKGWIKGRPLRFVRGHQNRSNGTPYEIDAGSGCWQWMLGRRADGYGQAYLRGKAILAHRLYYIEARGTIPQGLVLDHLCRNRRCVNPNHLEAVTIAENCRRGARVRVMPEQLAEIRSSPKSDRVLAREMGLGKSTIGAVRSGLSWSGS